MNSGEFEEPDEYVSTPEERYDASGTFDVISDDDFEKFPESFDMFGWPLFGDYDPYSLIHPITGRPWYEAPRVPNDNELDPEYPHWYYLATEFGDPHEFLASRMHRRKLNAPAQVSGDERMIAGYKNAAVKNLAYLRKHVRLRLKEMFAQRESSPEFAFLWGEYKAIKDSLRLSTQVEYHAQASESGGKRDDRSAQLKWYLHWRRHPKCVAMSAKVANAMFTKYVFDIVKKEMDPPPEFSIAWFEKAAYKYQGRIFKRRLPDTLRRALKDPRAHALLQSPAGQEPKIPPISDILARCRLE